MPTPAASTIIATTRAARLRPAVPVGMVLVRRAGGDVEAPQITADPRMSAMDSMASAMRA